MLAFLISAGLAAASGNYPATVQAEAGIPCAPTCTICHATNAGGSGTVTQPFGEAMMARGLTGGGNADALVTALAQLETDAVDSDGDGSPDVDALRAGQDPNDGTTFCGDIVVATPEYGCFQHARAGAGAPLIAAALLIGVSALRRRSRRIC
jgi:hypothetical protein